MLFECKIFGSFFWVKKMSSNSKRPFKLNNKNSNRYSKSGNFKEKADEILLNNKDISGITISPHGFWPDLPQTQRFFFYKFFIKFFIKINFLKQIFASQ